LPSIAGDWNEKHGNQGENALFYQILGGSMNILCSLSIKTGGKAAKGEIMGTDWYPNSRDEQLHMVKTWNTVFTTSGQTWGIPQDHITQLVNGAQAAETILDKVKSGERTTADVVQCNMIFKDMETEARFVNATVTDPAVFL
jgi:hypothetical protein